ncbi:MAG TPA: FHA domain-containing protein [Pyrinomonadaceae bacterium]|nr:FHA domain-containing protein [Pyrinomonadaceae bacterium]
MKIVLREIVAEQEQGSYEFDHRAIIQIGRDVQQCNVVFDSVRWPMVSRLHAEIRTEGDQCLLRDKNSTQGTFLNQNPVSAPIAIKTGDHIQLGQGGPKLAVEVTSTEPMRLHDTPVGMKEIIHDQSLTETHKLPTLIFEKGIPTERGSHFVLRPERTVIGRDPAADLVLDAGTMGVSRRHAEIRLNAQGRFQISDLNTVNGTLVNGQVIAQPTILNDGDRIQLSIAGPVLRFIDPAAALSQQKESRSPVLAENAARKSTSNSATPGDELGPTGGLDTLVYRKGIALTPPVPPVVKAKEKPLVQYTFDGKEKLSVGRAGDNDIQLDGLLISKYHARFIRTARALLLEDAGSTNGVFVNGARVTGRRPVVSEDIIQIGPFVLKADPIIGVSIFDTRSETRIDAIDITDVVTDSHNAPRKLLNGISLTIQPNEFVGLLGPSGAGKSVFMSVLNGMRPASGGVVLMNSLDLYQHLHSLKQSIGYVPQDDIIHRELTCYTTLYYVARLRLSRDVPAEDLHKIITEILELTGLTERRDVRISQLSGGQRKRVSIAVELITKPSVIFLDEPTSGLDPATEERIMKLFRQIAESGRTVILTTHAMENVHLFDKIVLLMRGRLIFYGTPNEALAFVGARNFIELYNKLEESVPGEPNAFTIPLDPDGASHNQKEVRSGDGEAAAEQWRQRFAATEIYQRNIAAPLSLVQQESKISPAVHLAQGTVDSLRQWFTLVARYARILASDKLNLLILLAQAPIIAVLTCLAVGKHDSRDFVYFVLALIPLWFGTSVAAREIVKERSIYKRERMVNLGLMPYVASKIFLLLCIVGSQCILLFGTLKVFHLANLLYLPGVFGGLGQWLAMVLTGAVGIALGLFISALVRTSEMATSIVPLLLIPQILFCGLVGAPTGVTRYVSAVMPATWSFDEMKRLSKLDTLRAEGSDSNGPNKGAGFYKHLEDTNLKSVRKARTDLEEYSRRANESLAQYDLRMKSSVARGDSRPILSGEGPPAIGSPPLIPEPEKMKDDLSDFVTFKHAWGGVVLNPLLLLVMFFALVAATLVVLRVQDPRAHKTR